jgi:hypothetical protein
MTGDGSGLVDVLGEYFMQEISHGRNGQFFSVRNRSVICSRALSAQRSRIPGRRSCLRFGKDAALGGQAQPVIVLLFGADNDITCVHMAAINLCLNGLFGEIAWMDTLTANKWYRGYKIELHQKGVPYIREIGEDESYLVLKVAAANGSKTPGTLSQQLVFHF